MTEAHVSDDDSGEGRGQCARCNHQGDDSGDGYLGTFQGETKGRRRTVAQEEEGTTGMTTAFDELSATA